MSVDAKPVSLTVAPETWSEYVDAWTQEAQPDNPLRTEGAERIPVPCAMVIFGVSGDLTARKLMPALYDLAVGVPLPEGFSIVGVSHRDWSEADFRQKMHDAVVAGARSPVTQTAWDHFAQGLFYVQGDFQDPATSPEYYLPIIHGLTESAVGTRQANYLEPSEGWHRIVVEKPFGHDLASARDLIAEMALSFTERQIYRIDHYLGKETVQNVMAFRFANTLFDPVWNRQYVDNVQITAAESIGIEGRGGYYDHAGALRDMV